MSTSSYAGRVGAAAFLLGIAFGAPVLGSSAVATAESPDSSISGAADSGGTASANHTTRGPRAAARSATRPAAADNRRTAAPAESRPAAALRASRSPVAPEQTVAAAPAPTAARLLGAATASARRSLFNSAPTVNPVQLTGMVEGPITGTLGATDPRGRTLTYAVTTDPRYGAVLLNSDGGYAYTPGPDFTGADTFVVAVTQSGRLGLFRRPKTTEASVSVAQGAQAPLVQFQFVYGAGSQYWSPEARSSLESAAQALASYLVVSSPVTITYAVTGERKPLSGTLASAGSDFTSSGAGFLQTVVQSKIQTGVDANGASPDGEITWNFGPKWGYGNSVSNTQYDFESTAMHELTHTLGFLSYIDKPGNNSGKTWTVFDSFVVDAAGNPVINAGDYTWNSAYTTNLTGGNGGLYFGGPNAVAAYNGPVPLYTPLPWSPGSSLSHLNDKVFAGSDEKLMNAVTGSGLGPRALSPAELGILADIGYQINTGSPVSTLMVVGVVFTRRLRRKD